jgi:hypothetical protein
MPEGGDRLDGQARRHRLMERVRTEQADYAALRAWLVKRLSSADGRTLHAWEAQALNERLASSLRERHRADGPRFHKVRGTSASEATLRRRLRREIASRSVDLRDPRVQAALDVVDPVTRRTALHLGLDRAEGSDDDYWLLEESQWGEALTVADVVPVFARHGRLREVVNAARELTGPYQRAEALAAALPHLEAPDRAEIANEAVASVITACRELSPRMWWRRLDVLEALAPVADNHGSEAIAAELRSVAKQPRSNMPPGDSCRAILIEAQLLLMLHASPQAADQLAVDGLTTAVQVLSEAVREAVLDVFTPLLQTAALDAGAELARTLGSSGRQASALAALARQAAEVGAAAKGSELIEEIARLPDLLANPTTAAVLGRNATLLTPTALIAIWCPAPGDGLLHGGSGGRRDDMVAAFDGLAPVLEFLGGSESIRAVEDASGMITRWWP